MNDTGAVCLAYCHANEVAHSWHLSMMELLGWDISHAQRVARGGFIAMRSGTMGLVEARNKVTTQFLESDAEWLFWIDTDMGFAPDTVDRLVASADAAERPVVGALCFAQREVETDGMGGFRCRPVPTVYQWEELEHEGRVRAGFAPMYEYPRDQLVRVAGTGSACILIHRDVLTKLDAEEPGNWYGRKVNPTTGQFLSEDLSFCGRAAAAGFPVYVDTSVKTTHLKQLWLGELDHEAAGR